MEKIVLKKLKNESYFSNHHMLIWTLLWNSLRHLPREICIFFNVYLQIIAEAYCLNNIHVSIWMNYCIYYSLSEQTPIISIIINKRDIIKEKTKPWNGEISRNSHWRCSVNKVFWKVMQNSQEDLCAGVSF